MGGSDDKESAYNVETRVRSLGWEDPLGKGMATHYVIPAWEIPWREELGRPQSRGCKESDTTESPTLSLSYIIFSVYNDVLSTALLVNCL